jgi:hypothetical protein
LAKTPHFLRKTARETQKSRRNTSKRQDRFSSRSKCEAAEFDGKRGKSGPFCAENAGRPGEIDEYVWIRKRRRAEAHRAPPPFESSTMSFSDQNFMPTVSM